MWRYNKGEWSESYVFLKLLDEGVLYAADAELNKIDDIYDPIIKVLHREFGKNMEFLPGDEIIVKMQNTEEPILRLPVEKFKRNSLLLLDKIRNAPKQARSFEIPEIESFLKGLNMTKVKADTGSKRDITVVVHDVFTGMNPTLGFSIKSQLGSPSTLLNASGKTNFIYELSDIDLSQEEIDEINALDRVIYRIEAIKSRGGRFKFVGTQEDILGLNMQVVDSYLPEIMAQLLLTHYSTPGVAMLEPILELVEERNPCNYSLTYGHPFYRYKIKKFLVEVALGMIPSEVWDGTYDATGGYIVVRADGEILCYHIYNRNEFEEYLIQNTRFDAPSTSRWEYGEIYKEKNKLYLKLCLQIRFIK